MAVAFRVVGHRFLRSFSNVWSPCAVSLRQQRNETTYSPSQMPKDKPFIMHSPFRPVDIPENVPFAQHVMEKFGEFSSRVAFVDGPSGKEWTYSQIQTSVQCVGSALRKMGFKKGDVATIFSPNCPEFGILFLGLASLGSITSAVNPLYTEDELLHALDHSESKMVVTIPALLSLTKAAVAKSKTCKEILVFGEGNGCRQFSSLLEDDGTEFPTSVDINPKEDLVALPYSSGTTGLPKGVMLTHENLLANIEQIRYDDTISYGEGDVFLGVLPFFHIYGQVVVLFGGLSQGVKIVTVPRFEPEMYLKLVQEQNATFLHVAPPLALFLAKHPLVEKFNLSSVKTVFCGAAPCGHDIAVGVCEKLGPQTLFRQGYGLTETSPVTHVNPTTKEGGKFGSIGFPVPNLYCKIVDIETGETLGANKDGEVCVKGPNIMKGYLNNPENTKDTLKNGWLHTGDIGRIDDDGHTFIVDRLKELIKYKGLQVAPAELENLLLTHPSIQDSAVIGIPDDRAGELPRAYVVLKPNQTASEEDIHAFLDGKVAPYKQLRGGIEFINEVPKSASGKILRRNLKSKYLEENSK